MVVMFGLLTRDHPKAGRPLYLDHSGHQRQRLLVSLPSVLAGHTQSVSLAVSVDDCDLRAIWQHLTDLWRKAYAVNAMPLRFYLNVLS